MSTTQDQTTETETETEEEKVPWFKSPKTWLKISILLIIIVCLVLAIAFNKVTAKIFTSFLEWMKENAALGAFAFIAVYWFATVFMIPGSLLTLGAGFVFRSILGIAGIFVATAIVLAGAATGATTAFILGRFVLREKVASYKSKYPKFDVVDSVISEQGLKVTFLLRLSPVIPFNIFNYFMGLTAVSFRDYNIAHIGMLPGTLAYCFIGGTLGAIGEGVSFGDNPTILIITIVGTVIALIGMIYISYVAKKEFNKMAERVNQNDDNEMGGVADQSTGTLMNNQSNQSNHNDGNNNDNNETV